MFLHTVHQDIGLHRELRSLLPDNAVTDGVILRHVMKITSDENERHLRLVPTLRHKLTHTYGVQLDKEHGHDPKRGASDCKNKSKTIQQFSHQVEALTNMIGFLKQAKHPE